MGIDMSILGMFRKIAFDLNDISVGGAENDLLIVENEVLNQEIKQFELKLGEIDAENLIIHF